MNHRALIVVCIVLTALSAAHASFDVSSDVIDNRILPSESARFEITIENEFATDDRFRLDFQDIGWIMRTEPEPYYFNGVAIDAGAQETFTIVLRPTSRLEVNNYRVEFSIRSEETGETRSVQIPVAITRGDGTVGEYLAIVRRLIEYPSTVDPRDEFTITVNLDNRNARNISNLTISIRSDVFNVTETTSLGPLESKKVDITVDLPDDLEPQEFTMVTSFTADGRSLSERFFDDVTVIAYEEIERNVSRSSGFFRTTRTYEYTNVGNAPTVVEDEQPVNVFSRIFSSVRIDGERTSKSVVSNATGTYLEWNVELATDETARVEITANYSLLFWIVVIAGAGFVVYLLMRSPITVRKDAVVVGVSEGGISEIRVVVHLKNMSTRKFLNISVIDSIPKIAEYVPDKEENMHTLRVYTNQREGSIVKWNLETLERYEERILTYRIRSKLSIVGGINLPRTLVRFTDDSGQEQVTRSNSERVTL